MQSLEEDASEVGKQLRETVPHHAPPRAAQGTVRVKNRRPARTVATGIDLVALDHAGKCPDPRGPLRHPWWRRTLWERKLDTFRDLQAKKRGRRFTVRERSRGRDQLPVRIDVILGGV